MAKKAQKQWTKQVSELKKPVGVTKYCSQFFPILASKTAARKAIADGRLLLNGEKARPKDLVQNGDQLQLQGFGIQKARAFSADLDIVFEDDHLLVINKPGGIAVNGNRNKTVENALAGLVKPSSKPDALPRPIAVHRIDVPTIGLVLLAKTKKALINLPKAFQKNQVKKEYLAVVHGKPPPEGKIDQAIHGKKAVTYFETIRAVPSRVYKHLALVRLRPHTGRTHQLRIHFQKLGHLIVGDKMYAKSQKTILGKGLFLCACKLEFKHPETEEVISCQIKTPKKFHKLLDREKERFY